MKIGILSMQDVDNYGSFLQAYGLKTILEERGHEVHFIKILRGEPFVYDIEERKRTVLHDYYAHEKLYCKIERKINRFIFRKLLKQHRKKYLGNSQIIKDQFDCVVIGSDEVFNCMQKSEWGFSMQLLGEIHNVSLVMSYAASCGGTEEANLIGDYRRKAQNALANIHFISVRDQNTYNFVKILTGREAVFHLDPVLISNYSSFWINRKMRSKYLLIYVYSKRIREQEDIDKILGFAKRNHLKVIAIGGFHSWCDSNLLVSPREIFSVFSQAEFVITDTFHGTVFSAIANTNFVTIIRKENQFKLEDLLTRLGFIEQNLRDLNQLDLCYHKKIDFSQFNQNLKKERQRTISYFEKCGL